MYDDRPSIDSSRAQSAARIAGYTAPLTHRGISVVLPAWNEEAVIGETIAQVTGTMTRVAPDYEIIVVNDGSQDRTGPIIDALAAVDPHVRPVHHATNQGYGAALIDGFAAARKELVFFMDPDGQFDSNDIDLLIMPYEAGKGDVIAGYRAHRHDPPVRILNAWAWKQLVSMLFQITVRDIDCAFKLIPTALIHQANVQAQGAMVNTELLAKFARMGVTVAQVPVNHYPRLKGQASGANLRVIVNAFRELFRLYGKLQAWMPEQNPVRQGAPDGLPV